MQHALNYLLFSEEILTIIASEENKNVTSFPDDTFNRFRLQIISELKKYHKENPSEFIKKWKVISKLFILIRERTGSLKDNKYPYFFSDLLKFEDSNTPLIDFWSNNTLPDIDDIN